MWKANKLLTAGAVGVVSHGFGGLGGAGMEVLDGIHAGQSQGGLSHVERCRSTFRVQGDTRSHRLAGAQLWVGSSRNWSVFFGRP